MILLLYGNELNLTDVGKKKNLYLLLHLGLSNLTITVKKDIVPVETSHWKEEEESNRSGTAGVCVTGRRKNMDANLAVIYFLHIRH